MDLGIPVGGIREARSPVSARIRVKERKGGDTAVLRPGCQECHWCHVHVQTTIGIIDIIHSGGCQKRGYSITN